MSGFEQAIQVAFSSRSMRRNIFTPVSAKLRTPGGYLGATGGPYPVVSAVLGAAISTTIGAMLDTEELWGCAIV